MSAKICSLLIENEINLTPIRKRRRCLGKCNGKKTENNLNRSNIIAEPSVNSIDVPSTNYQPLENQDINFFSDTQQS